MSYAIIGFGNIGQALAKAFARNGIEVSVATTRDPESFASAAAAIGPTIIPKKLAETVKADIVFLAVRFESHHSYGGVVVTESGTDPKVAGLVYIAAFAPDKGESVSALIKNPPPGAPVPPILPPQDGFLFLDRAKFRASFAADVSPEAAAFMADSQVPWGLEALNGAVTKPAWRSKPSWYLVSTDDKMIPPDAQRAMSKRAGATVVEVKGSHAVYVSQPKAVASLIAKAASGVAVATQ